MEKESLSISGIRKETVEAEFPLGDVLIARMLVREYVAKGLRKGPSDLLLLDNAAMDKWLSEEAVVYLKEQKARRQAVIAEIQ